MWNDTYTLCELVHGTYCEEVTNKNIIAGFKVPGIC